MSVEIRCKSPYCIVRDNIRGRIFTPSDDVEGLAKIYCPDCIKLGTQIQFYSTETAKMIRNTYRAYIDTDLPAEVKLILEQFTREVIAQFGEEI